jgi:hypothetical protein
MGDIRVIFRALYSHTHHEFVAGVFELFFQLRYLFSIPRLVPSSFQPILLSLIGCPFQDIF